MIGFISGTVKAVRKNYIILATDFVGYKVFVTPQILLNLTPAQKLALYIHTYVREDQITLYGFATPAELDFFELLITVSGVGPRSALSIMSVAELGIIKQGILNRDPEMFTKVSGVGRKTAERLIVELKEKISDEIDAPAAGAALPPQAEVVDVLMALGYSRTEARKALDSIPRGLKESEEKIRYALRSLAKQ